MKKLSSTIVLRLIGRWIDSVCFRQFNILIVTGLDPERIWRSCGKLCMFKPKQALASSSHVKSWTEVVHFAFIISNNADILFFRFCTQNDKTNMRETLHWESQRRQEEENKSRERQIKYPKCCHLRFPFSREMFEPFYLPLFVQKTFLTNRNVFACCCDNSCSTVDISWKSTIYESLLQVDPEIAS